MLWILLLLIALLLAGLVLVTPARTFRLARANARRPDGSAHPERRRAEAEHFAGFVAELLLAPLFAVVLAGALVVGVHEYVMPIPMIADVASMFDADMAVWDERMETGKLGDVGVVYHNWRLSQGHSAASADFWRAFLRHYWPVLLGLTLLFAALQYWFWTRYYARVVEAYHGGVRRRHERYRREDSHGPPPKDLADFVAAHLAQQKPRRKRRRSSRRRPRDQ